MDHDTDRCAHLLLFGKREGPSSVALLPAPSIPTPSSVGLVCSFRRVGVKWSCENMCENPVVEHLSTSQEKYPLVRLRQAGDTRGIAVLMLYECLVIGIITGDNIHSASRDTGSHVPLIRPKKHATASACAIPLSFPSVCCFCAAIQFCRPFQRQDRAGTSGAVKFFRYR
jgi:hypothetical protein